MYSLPTYIRELQKVGKQEVEDGDNRLVVANSKSVKNEKNRRERIIFSLIGNLHQPLLNEKNKKEAFSKLETLLDKEELDRRNSMRKEKGIEIAKSKGVYIGRVHGSLETIEN